MNDKVVNIDTRKWYNAAPPESNRDHWCEWHRYYELTPLGAGVLKVFGHSFPLRSIFQADDGKRYIQIPLEGLDLERNKQEAENLLFLGRLKV